MIAAVITMISIIDFSTRFLSESSKIFNAVMVKEKIADKMSMLLLFLSDKPNNLLFRMIYKSYLRNKA
nr:MAG TPA: hypothetical protein [Caudoviricetes sp.]